MTYKGGADYERAGRVAYYVFIVVLVGVALYTSTRPRAPDPSNSKAFGCYTTENAAPILLDAKGMAILQSVAIRIKYHIERTKTGIALTADAPIAAEPMGNRYTFVIKPPGEGWHLDFFNVIDGRRYGVFDENQLSQFSMLALDGTYLPYSKAPLDACRTVAAQSR
jgi:hypothetical protein